MDEAGGNGRAGPPWASLLDPLANARALGEVQAMGLRAASELVERVIRAVDGDDTEPVVPPDPGASASDDPPGPGADIGPMVAGWADFLRRTADSFARVATGDEPAAANADANNADAGEVRVDIVSGSAPRAVRTVVEAGAIVEGTAEVWLHNTSETAIGPVALHCGEVVRSDRVELYRPLSFDPAMITELPARSSRGVALRISLDIDAVPGTYRGVVQAEGAPMVFLPIEIVVRDSA